MNEEELVKLMTDREDFKYVSDNAPNNAEKLKDKLKVESILLKRKLELKHLKLTFTQLLRLLE